MPEEEPDKIEDKIATQLEECAGLLLACEVENKKCRWCRGKSSCKIFIRSVMAALCKLEVVRMNTPQKQLSEHMYT